MKTNIFIFIVLSLLLEFIIISCKDDKRKIDDEMKNHNDNLEELAPPPDPSPKIISKPIINFPFSKYEVKENGIVHVRVVVDTTGKVTNAKSIWSSNRIFEAVAESLAYHYVFNKPIFNGRVSKVSFTLPIEFKYNNKDNSQY